MRSLVLGFGAVALASVAPAWAQSGGGMTVEEIAAAATGAPMNGGMLTLRKAPSANGVPYYLATIPNTDIEFGVGGVACGGTPAKCRGVGFIFPAGTANSFQQETIDKINLNAPYNKFYRVQSVLVLTIEQSLIGGGTATVRESVVNLERGIAKLIEVMDRQGVQIRYDIPEAKIGAGEGPPLTLVFSEAQKTAVEAKGGEAAIEAVAASWSAASD